MGLCTLTLWAISHQEPWTLPQIQMISRCNTIWRLGMMHCNKHKRSAYGSGTSVVDVIRLGFSRTSNPLF